MQADGAFRGRAISSLIVVSFLLAALVTTGAKAVATFADMDRELFSVSGRTVPVIVQKSVNDTMPERAVARLGGRLTQPLWIVNGFAADVPAASVRSLATIPGIRSVTLDRKVHVLGLPSSTPRSVYPKVIRANEMNSSGYTG